MAYFNQYYNPDRGPKPYDVPGYYRNNTPEINTDVNIPQYRPGGNQPSLQTPGLSMMNGQGMQAPQGQSLDNFGNVAQGVASGVSMVTDWKSMGDQANDIPTNGPALQYDSDGRAVYNQGQFANETMAIKPKGASAGEILGGVGKGASMGASIGSVVPGLGTAVGAVVGGVIGGVGSVFGGARRKRKMRAAKRRAQQSLANRQGQYNRSTENANAQDASRAQYYESLNNSNRLYNLYNTNI